MAVHARAPLLTRSNVHTLVLWPVLGLGQLLLAGVRWALQCHTLPQHRVVTTITAAVQIFAFGVTVAARFASQPSVINATPRITVGVTAAARLASIINAKIVLLASGLVPGPQVKYYIHATSHQPGFGPLGVEQRLSLTRMNPRGRWRRRRNLRRVPTTSDQPDRDGTQNRIASPTEIGASPRFERFFSEN